MGFVYNLLPVSTVKEFFKIG